MLPHTWRGNNSTDAYAWMGLLPLSVRTPLAHSASLAFENWTGRNNNEAEKKGKEAERVKLACGARDNAPGCGRGGREGTSPRRRASSNLATTENQRNLLVPQLRLQAKNVDTFFYVNQDILCSYSHSQISSANPTP